jgi:hypothetical protein
MKEQLAAFLDELDGKGVVWGKTDCSATPHMWLARLGINAALPPYRSREEAHAIIERHGSLVATWDWCLRDTAVYERGDAPQLGDIAVIDTRLYRQIGGIVAAGNILIVRKDDGNFQWFGPVRRFAKVWAVS